jgi:hypothetical protein
VVGRTTVIHGWKTQRTMVKTAQGENPQPTDVQRIESCPSVAGEGKMEEVGDCCAWGPVSRKTKMS